MLDQKKLKDLTTLTFFLFHMERDQPRAMYGTYTVSEAFDACAGMMNCDPEKLRNACCEAGDD